MKVLFVNTNDNGGGAAIACRRIQKALATHTGVEGKILVQQKNTRDEAVVSMAPHQWQQWLAWGRFVAERLYFYPHERSAEVRFQFNPGVVGADISSHPLVREADLIHLHWVNFGYQSTDSLKKLFALGKPVVWTFHDMWAFTGGCHHSGTCENYRGSCGLCKFVKHPGPDDISHRRWLAKEAAYVPFAAVGCSQWLARRAAQSSLLRQSRVLSIPNPIDTSVFKPVARHEARQRLGLPPEKAFILFAAMRVNAAGKGFSYLAEALHLLTRQHPGSMQHVEVLIFGHSGTDLTAALPIRAHVLGHLSDPQQIVLAYSAASVFVIPSLEENLPNTIMEALACGTPAVGFATGGIPEMIDHRINGFVAEYRSADSLAEGIRWVLENNASATLSTQARQKVLDTYSEKTVAGQYHDLYQSLLGPCHS